jgi:hypothetical protein
MEQRMTKEIPPHQNSPDRSCLALTPANFLFRCLRKTVAAMQTIIANIKNGPAYRGAKSISG